MSSASGALLPATTTAMPLMMPLVPPQQQKPMESVVQMGFAAGELKRYFDHSLLDAPDVYYPGQHRFRRYGALRKVDGVWRLAETQSFSQQTTVNTFLGGVERTYKPLTMTLVSEAAFQALLENFVEASFASLQKHFDTVHCHQIKVMADTAETVVTPEGVHQDGFDAVAVACVRRHCVTGARTLLRATKDSTPFFDDVLPEGQLVLFDDRRLWHDVSPMLPVVGSRPYDTNAYRDILVLHATADESL